MNRRFLRTAALALAVSCLFVSAVFATESTTGSYGIQLTVAFSDEDKKSHPLEDYSCNCFQLLDEAGAFAQAEYSSAEEAYLVTGFGSEETATTFHSGNVADRPGELTIVGLDEGTYYLRQTETAKDYTALRDDVECVISYDVFTVNGGDMGNAISKGRQIGSFSIIVSPYFELPTGTWWGTKVGLAVHGVLTLAFFLLGVVALWLLLRKK